MYRKPDDENLPVSILGRHEDHSSALHRRLFTPGPSCLLMDGEPVSYISAQGDYLLSGTVMLNPQGVSGIICGCCSNVVDCPTVRR